MNFDSRIDAPADHGGDGARNPLLEVDDEDRRSKRWLIISAVAGVLAMIAVWFMVHKGDGAAEAEKGKEQAPVITVVTPGRATIAGQITGTGTLAARRELPVGILAKVARWSGCWLNPASGSDRARCWQ